jgi:hypothetical protein
MEIFPPCGREAPPPTTASFAIVWGLSGMPQVSCTYLAASFRRNKRCGGSSGLPASQKVESHVIPTGWRYKMGNHCFRFPIVAFIFQISLIAAVVRFHDENVDHRRKARGRSVFMMKTSITTAKRAADHIGGQPGDCDQAI